VDRYAPFRVASRLIRGVCWIFVCWAAIRVVEWSGSSTLRKRIARLWLKRMLPIFGMRVKTVGTPPPDPYFLVTNHITWGDLFVMEALCDMRCVVQAEDATFPFLGRLFLGLDPIFSERSADQIPRLVNEMTATIRAGGNILLAPEGVVGPGRAVRRFRPALLESAVQTGCPVHYASITCRTPDGYPPASKVVLFGPDPYYRTPDGKIPDSELEAWGPERSFFIHLVKLLALPWHEFTVRFAPEPIRGTDKVQLAKDLQAAVQSIFIPVP